MLEAETELLRFMREQKSELRDAIINSKSLDDASEASLKQALLDFLAQWAESHKTVAK